MLCESRTTKKAWRNPLAPMARCQNTATMTVEKKDVAWGKPQHACTLHGKRLLEGGWTKVTP